MERLLSRKETAKILGIGLTKLDAEREAGRITYIQHKENGSVFFTESGIQEYIARGTHRAIQRSRSAFSRRHRGSY